MLKQRLQDDMKAALKGGDKPRLAVVRLILAAIKQREVDRRLELTDEQILAVLDEDEVSSAGNPSATSSAPVAPIWWSRKPSRSRSASPI